MKAQVDVTSFWCFLFELEIRGVVVMYTNLEDRADDFKRIKRGYYVKRCQINKQNHVLTPVNTSKPPQITKPTNPSPLTKGMEGNLGAEGESTYRQTKPPGTHNDLRQ